MLGQEAPRTDYDLHFRCLGFPVRVHPWFWLTSAFVVWSPDLARVLVGIVAVFVSILVHELGHALAGRYYGGRSEIVLHFFGGYATRTVNPSRMGNIFILAAGPAAGFLLWGVTVLLIRTVNLRGAPEPIIEFLGTLLIINWYWSLMNLLPVWPLDGGQIAHQVIGKFRALDAWELTLKLSILACIGVIVWSMNSTQGGEPDKFLIVMFALLAFQNFQTLQMSGRGSW